MGTGGVCAALVGVEVGVGLRDMEGVGEVGEVAYKWTRHVSVLRIFKCCVPEDSKGREGHSLVTSPRGQMDERKVRKQKERWSGLLF